MKKNAVTKNLTVDALIDLMIKTAEAKEPNIDYELCWNAFKDTVGNSKVLDDGTKALLKFWISNIEELEGVDNLEII